MKDYVVEASVPEALNPSNSPFLASLLFAIDLSRAAGCGASGAAVNVASNSESGGGMAVVDGQRTVPPLS